MLKQLFIKNIILVENADIEFAEGFNVLSGETGSGKTAIMNAIYLITGCRAETSMIRKGAEKGIVQAVFDIKGNSLIRSILEQGGIDFEEEGELYIRREISLEGKSRAFINNQLAQLSLLRALCAPIIHLVGQHANQELLSLDRHREILDVFGGLKEDVFAFSKSWEQENALQQELERLVNSETQRVREAEICQRTCEEIEEARLKEGEDEELFHEYTLLSHAEEIGTKVESLIQVLSGEKLALLSQLQRQKNTFDSLLAIDPSLTEVAHSFHHAVLEIQEVTHSLNLYHSRLEYNPERLAAINDRLTLITRIKKKYGSTLQEIHAFAEENKKKWFELQNADHRIEELHEEIRHIQEKNHQLAKQLTQRRTETARQLAAILKNELRSLNMSKVDFHIEVTSQKRSRTGDDRVEFFLLPNVGEHRISLKTCASGGELSRVMLSLQVVLCDKEHIPILVFDEIDANIGGETAKVVGEKLKKIGQKQQVLCITHFPQVARQADHHLRISKNIVGERTITCIQSLDDNMRETELDRMVGN